MRAAIFFLILGVTTITQAQGFGLFIGDGPCPFPDGCGIGDQNGGGEVPLEGWVPGFNCTCNGGGGSGGETSGDDTTAEWVNSYPPCPSDICSNQPDDEEEGGGHCCNCCCSKCKSSEAEQLPTIVKDGNKDSDGDGCPDWLDPYPDDSTRGCDDRKLPWEGKEEELDKEWSFNEWLPVSELEFEGTECCEYLITMPYVFGYGGGVYINLSTCLGEGWEGVDAWRTTIRGWLVIALGWIFSWRAIKKIGG